jgi:hypothetical protein
MTASALFSWFSPVLYLVGTLLLIPGTVLLLPSFEDSAVLYRAAIGFLVAATSLLSAAALYDFGKALSCAGFTPGAALNHPLIDEPKEETTVCAMMFVPTCMLLGGIFFFVGSMLYWSVQIEAPIN